MNSTMIQQTTDTQSSFAMSGYRHAFAPCTNAAHFAVRIVDLAQGQVALEPATRKGWVRGTSAWRPPIVSS